MKHIHQKHAISDFFIWYKNLYLNMTNIPEWLLGKLVARTTYRDISVGILKWSTSDTAISAHRELRTIYSCSNFIAVWANVVLDILTLYLFCIRQLLTLSLAFLYHRASLLHRGPRNTVHDPLKLNKTDHLDAPNLYKCLMQKWCR